MDNYNKDARVVCSTKGSGPANNDMGLQPATDRFMSDDDQADTIERMNQSKREERSKQTRFDFGRVCCHFSPFLPSFLVSHPALPPRPASDRPIARSQGTSIDRSPLSLSTNYTTPPIARTVSPNPQTPMYTSIPTHDDTSPFVSFHFTSPQRACRPSRGRT